MVDRLPMIRIVTPAHEQLIAQRVSITAEPVPLLLIPIPFYVASSNQDVRLLFISFDDFARLNVFRSVHPIMTFVIENELPLPMQTTVAFEGSTNYFFEELTMTPGFL